MLLRRFISSRRSAEGKHQTFAALGALMTLAILLQPGTVAAADGAAAPEVTPLTAAVQTAAVDHHGAAALVVTGSGCDPYRVDVDFGALAVGSRGTFVNSVRNSTTADLVIDPICDDPAITLDVSRTVIPPGQHAFVLTHYQPAAVGVLDAVITLGNGLCPSIQLAGSGVAAHPDGNDLLGIYWDQEFLVTDLRVSGSAQLANGYLVLSNASTPGGVAGWECRLDIDGPAVLTGMAIEGLSVNVGTFPDFVVGLAEPLPYQDDVVLANVQFFVLDPAVTSLISLVPASIPSVAGQMNWVGERDFGILLDMVPASGVPLVATISADPTGHCFLFRSEIDFGPLAVGSRGHYNNHLTNRSQADIVLDPRCEHPDVKVVVSRTTVRPGESAYLDIFYEPSSVGAMATEIDLGTDACNVIPVFGSGTAAHPAGSDQIGIYWDEEHTSNSLAHDGISPVAVGYLVMQNPSAEGGLQAWECRVEIVGSAMLTGANIDYSHVNVGNAPDFIVGLATPVPFQTEVVMATLFFSVPDPFGASLISLVPTSIASVEGQMSWIAGRDNDNIIDMLPATGTAIVASINVEAPVAVALPTPRAEALGRRVELSWTVGSGPWDGFHVYGRSGGNTAVRLTDTPLVADGNAIRFSDDLAGYTAGTTVYYSYAAVKAGAELGRSPEVEVVVPAVPLIVTRLLPNVPNPFNPATEIRFELGGAGHVKVKIYDITGRLVTTLVSGNRAAGPHSEVWQGRDERGRPLPSGAYYVRMVTRDGVENRKIMLLK